MSMPLVTRCICVRVTFSTSTSTRLTSADRSIRRLHVRFATILCSLVAQALVQGVGSRAVLRCHPPIDPEKASSVIALAESLGFKGFNVSSVGAIHNSLLSVAARSSEAARVLEYVVTKPMKPAQYFTTGSKEDASSWAHYALAIPYYTHFTSPIRRYADVMVHRLLAETLDAAAPAGETLAPSPAVGRPIPSGNRKVGKGREQPKGKGAAVSSAPTVNDGSPLAVLSAQCDLCNESKAGAKEAQEGCDKVYLTLYIAGVQEQQRQQNQLVAGPASSASSASLAPPSALGLGGVDVECLVVDIGPGTAAFTVLVTGWDVERRIYLDRCGWEADWDVKDGALVLRSAADGVPAAGGDAVVAGGSGVASASPASSASPAPFQGKGTRAQARAAKQAAFAAALGSPATDEQDNDTPSSSAAASPAPMPPTAAVTSASGGRRNGAQARPPQALFTISQGQRLPIGHLTRFKARAIALMDRVPIDWDLQLTEVLKA